MKKGFIRTPSEIYDLDDLYVCEELNGKPYGVKGSWFCIYKESIIKTADTVEELCDEFVVVHKELNGSHTVHRYNWLGKSEHKAENEVYGAIWTDKGLIYVAKMKGVLPNGEIDWELL